MIFINFIDTKFLILSKIFKYFKKTKDKNTYFAVMVALKMLLDKKEYDIYQEQVETLFSELQISLSTISIKKIQDIMGIPGNMKKIKSLVIK